MNADDLNRLGMRGPVREMYLFMRKHGISEVRLKKRGTECDAEVYMDADKPKWNGPTTTEHWIDELAASEYLQKPLDLLRNLVAFGNPTTYVYYDQQVKKAWQDAKDFLRELEPKAAAPMTESKTDEPE